MNPRLDLLQPYPFERLAALKRDLRPPPGLAHLALSIGEPKHPPPPAALAALAESASGGGVHGYPATRGGEALRETISGWLARRFGLEPAPDPATQVLPVNGTREALFAFAQCVVDATAQADARVLMPNPFYQIYEGAALLAGATPIYMNCDESGGFLPDLDAVADADWRRCQLIYVCSPGNPAGAVWPRPLWRRLLDLADRHDFIIASDECYSEIYFDEDEPPVGLLQVCAELGRDDYARCLVFNSLSKRSNLAGLRSGLVAGDAALIAHFLRYRTYQGGAMSGAVQAASCAAWNDEAHVRENRVRYRDKLDALLAALPAALATPRPQAGFFLWPRVPGGDDVAFAARLFARQNMTVLPGSFLARDAVTDGTAAVNSGGSNPGRGRIRLALVPPLDDCLQAAARLQAQLNDLSDQGNHE